MIIKELLLFFPIPLPNILCNKINNPINIIRSKDKENILHSGCIRSM